MIEDYFQRKGQEVKVDGKTPEELAEIIKTNNINAIVIKNNTGRMYSNNIFSSNFKTTNFQVEFELSIPNIKSSNIYFTFYINNNQSIIFDIQPNALSIRWNNKSIKAGFKFKSNIKYTFYNSEIMYAAAWTTP